MQPALSLPQRYDCKTGNDNKHGSNKNIPQTMGATVINNNRSTIRKGFKTPI